MKKTLLILIAVILGLSLNAQQKKNLKILYVGYSPDKAMPVNKMPSSKIATERAKSEYPKRMPSFEKMLKQYFTEVATMDARDYKQSDSENYDVTIFDAMTKPIEASYRGKDPDTGEYIYRPAKYLTKDYSKPTILIGSVAANMTRPLGSKTDWK